MEEIPQLHDHFAAGRRAGPGPWGKEGEKEDRVGWTCHPDLAMSYLRFALKLSRINSIEVEPRFATW